MPRKCSAPLCSVDDSGDFFRLFHLPHRIEVRAEWQARISLSSAVSEEVKSGVKIYLCEIHFDEFCWDDADGERTLKETAVPSIFQHTTSLEYIDKLYIKLKSANVCTEIVEHGIQTIEKLKSEAILGNHEVQNEVIQFSSLSAVSGMQKLRICQKSSTIASTEAENIMLAQEVNELLRNVFRGLIDDQ